MTGYLPKVASPNLPNAACVKVDPEIFFAEDCQYPDKEVVEQARNICLGCLDRVPCLMWGLGNEDFGMWGGLTANERKDFKKRKMKRLTHVKNLGLI